MEHVAPILHALASLAWVVFAFIALRMFKTEIAGLFSRLKKIKKGEYEVKFEQLNNSAAASIEEVKKLLPVVETRMASADQEEAIEGTIRSILQQATSAPKVALMMLRAELEKQALQGLATRGLLRGRPVVPLSQALSDLSQYGIPQHLAPSARLFVDVSNKIIHGAAGTNDDVLKALASGITILRALNALPNEVNVVYGSGVAIFSDAMCTIAIPDAKGVILETTPPGGGMKTLRIFPTTRTHFQEGKQVAWEWNMHRVWPAAWYRDPDTQTIKLAWDQAAEFIGRHLDEIF